MTHTTGDGVLWIQEEPPGRCELCGVVEETRPYGPNDEQICFGCGEKDPETTLRKFQERIASAGTVRL